MNKKHRKMLEDEMNAIGAVIPKGKEEVVHEILDELLRKDDTLLRIGAESVLMAKGREEDLVEGLFGFCCQEDEGADVMVAIVLAVASELLAKAGTKGINMFWERVQERLPEYHGHHTIVVKPSSTPS